MIVQELEIPLSQATLQDCIDMYFFCGMSAIINDGELKGFEKEPYVQEIWVKWDNGEALCREFDFKIGGRNRR